MKLRQLRTFLLALLIIGVGVFVYIQYGEKLWGHSAATSPTRRDAIPMATSSRTIPKPNKNSTSPGATTVSSDVHDAPSVESYVKKHIAEFSTIKSTLGGIFYVTRVDTHQGVGTVYYEDGHSSYIADFTYSIDDFGSLTIDTFIVRK